MYQVFSSLQDRHAGVKTPPGWHYVHDGLSRNLAEVVGYYRGAAMAVASEHFLVRLIQSINVPLTMSLERYMDNVDNLALRLSMALKMTSAIYRGQMFDGVFYGKGNPEILIATDESFDIDEAVGNWRHLNAITVLRSPITSLNLALPDGQLHTGDASGLGVFLINIPLLALQYRCWTLADQEEALRSGGVEKTVMEFVHMVVLPNMMGSHLDYVLFNRLSALQQHIELDTMSLRHRVHPFYLTDFREKLNIAQQEMLDLLATSSHDFSGTLQAIPLVHRKTLAAEMVIPNMVPTFQLMWALSVARLPALQFLFNVSANGPTQKNRQEVSVIMRDIKMYRRNSIMKTLPPELFASIEAEMNGLVDVGGAENRNATA